MKKFIYTMLAFMFVLPLAFGLVGCQKDETVKAEDVTGTWYVETYVHSYNGSTDTSTQARLVQLHDKASKTTDEEDEYADLATVIYMWKATADGKLYCKPYYDADSEYAEYGTWAIEDGKLTATITWFAAGETTVEYKGGKIIINYTRMWLEKPETTVVTLAKV